jgi:hypothetical protein
MNGCIGFILQFFSFSSSSLLPLWSTELISQFLDYSQTVGFLGRLISRRKAST